MMKTPSAGFGVVPIEQARTMDGMTLFGEIMAGRLPAPPMAKALGFWIEEVELGRVVFGYSRCSSTTIRWAACMAASPPPCSIR